MRASNSNQGQQSLLPDANEINEYIKEYLRYSHYSNTLECFEAEIKSKQITNNMLNEQQIIKQTGNNAPSIFQLLKNDNIKTKREINLEKEQKIFNKKYQQILYQHKSIIKQLLTKENQKAPNQYLNKSCMNIKLSFIQTIKMED